MKITRTAAAVAAVIGLGALGAASAASAHIVCNSDGDCWHVDNREHYPNMRLTYHPDDWYFHRHWDNDRQYHWREAHEGRGYWRGGVWIPFPR